MQDSTFEATLEKNGLSNTKSRRILFHILSNSHDPLTLPELVKLVKSSMNKTTVYRTLETFENIGVVKIVSSGLKHAYELSDDYVSHHHHMTCLVCGKIISFEESYKLLAELERLEEAYRFIIEDHNIELRGRCNSCRL